MPPQFSCILEARDTFACISMLIKACSTIFYQFPLQVHHHRHIFQVSSKSSMLWSTIQVAIYPHKHRNCLKIWLEPIHQFLHLYVDPIEILNLRARSFATIHCSKSVILCIPQILSRSLSYPCTL